MTEPASALQNPFPFPQSAPVRMGVLISGGGRTMENFVAGMKAGTLPVEIPLVIASRSDCGGIARAERLGLRCEIVQRKDFPSTAAFSERIFDLLREANTDLVALSGFLSLLQIPDDFAWRVLNIHPSLIPSFCGQGFYGDKVHEAALERGVKVSGCTVHFADNKYDHGPILVQQTVPVLDDDDPHTLAARVFEAECIAYPEAIRQLIGGELRLLGNRVVRQ